MRNFLGGLFLVALMAPHLASAATPSINGTTIPTAPQIVDSQSNVWTLASPAATRIVDSQSNVWVLSGGQA